MYYDFSYWGHVSYGYQVPFGPRDTQPRQTAHYRQVFVADKGPFYVRTSRTIYPLWEDSANQPLRPDSPPSAWRQYNSRNHGGPSVREGQNCLFTDGAVEFFRTPLAGIDGDNIYTGIDGESWGFERFALFHGITPHTFAPESLYPGRDALGQDIFSSTDSLIYP